MAEVAVRDGALHIRLTVAERMLAVHGRDIEVALSEVAAVAVVPDVLAEIRGLRLPGAGVPGVVAIGTWRGRVGEESFRDFALVHHGGPGVVVSISGGDYDRLIFGTDDPDEFAREIRG